MQGLCMRGGKGELEAHILLEDLQFSPFLFFFLVSFGLGIVRVGFLLPIFRNVFMAKLWWWEF